MSAPRRLATVGLLLLPGALTAYLSFNAGGFFAGVTAQVAVALTLVLILRVTLAQDPFAGFSRSLVAAVAALALFAVWTLASAGWSQATARPIFAFDLVLVYLLGLLIFGTLERTPARLRLMVRGLALAATAVAGAALVSRVLPELWPIAPNINPERLSYPLTYWNALGLLCALGLTFCLHLTCSEREPRTVRVLTAGAQPILAVTLLFTLSRGSIAVAAGGMLLYLLLARPRGLLGGLVATVPVTAVAVMAAYDAELLVSDDPTSSAAVAQGEQVALAVALCVVVALLARCALLWLDARLERATLGMRIGRRGMVVAALASLAVAGTALAAVDAPSYVRGQIDRFAENPGESGVVLAEDRRMRLDSVSNNGRLDAWQAALEGFRSDPWQGHGAGTYRLLWERHRPEEAGESQLTNAHSL